jgi:hypothetical protein
MAKILLFPTDQQIRAARKKLPKFEAHDLRSLINEAKANENVEFDAAFLLAFRERNEMQMKKLLQRLGIDPSKPDAWMTGFFLLAYYHCGIGHIAWRPMRTNRNSATWTVTQDLALLREVMILRERGYSQRRAIKLIATDPKKRSLFPYRRKGHFSTGSEQKKREAALRAHLQKLLVSTRGKSIGDLIIGVRHEALSPIVRTLYDFDVSNSLQQGLVKNQPPFKRTDS